MVKAQEKSAEKDNYRTYNIQNDIPNFFAKVKQRGVTDVQF